MRRKALGTTAVILVVIIIIAAVVVVGAYVYQDQGCCPANHVFGGLPYVVLTPQNLTYSLPLAVRTSPSLTISFDSAHSHAVQFSTGTRWVYTGGACNPGYNGTATTVTMSTTDCSLGADGYVPEGGTVTDGSVNLTDSQTTFNIEPSSLPANFNGNVTVSVNMRLQPGVYALYLFVDYSTNGGTPTYEALGPEAIVITG